MSDGVYSDPAMHNDACTCKTLRYFILQAAAFGEYPQPFKLSKIRLIALRDESPSPESESENGRCVLLST